MADHCRQYALSDPENTEFKSQCKHNHNDKCVQCELLSSTLKEVTDALDKMTTGHVTEDEQEEITFKATQAKQNILSWKAHLLRNVNQDEARLDMLNKLDERSAFLVQDWAMKFLPRKFRESQADWFGKRGISWHITVATRRTLSNEFECMTFVNVIKSCNQDSGAVLGVMDDVVRKLKATMPSLESIYYRQDNAGCYRSGATIIGANKIGSNHGVSIKRLDFCDPQGGKGPCDRKAAIIKSHMRRHLNEGNDVENGEEMKSAMESSGGVTGVHVSLCESSPSVSSVKLDGVSTISNVEYSGETLRIWKAYGIGEGKELNLKAFEDATPTPHLDVSDNVVTDKFTAKVQIQSKTAKSICNSEEEDVNKNQDVDPQLFCCPEEGCIKTYKRFSDLSYHLDCGKHERVAESYTMLDKAALNYARKLEEPNIGVPKLHEPITSDESSCATPLPMGWALRTNQPAKRFSEKQKEYLKSKFLLGEATGRKLDPKSVARSMMKAKDTDGKRLFSSDEFLNSQQISGFFSRLAAKRSLHPQHMQEVQCDSDDENSQDKEQEFSTLQSEVMAEIMVDQHPITYDVYNICELAGSNKLNKFSVAMLNEICNFLQIHLSKKCRRKAPYIERIVELVKNCGCQVPFS